MKWYVWFRDGGCGLSAPEEIGGDNDNYEAK